MAQPRRICGHVASARKSAFNVSCHSDDLVLLVFELMTSSLWFCPLFVCFEGEDSWIIILVPFLVFFFFYSNIELG